MSANDSVLNDSICQRPDWFWKTAEVVHFSSYYIVMPIYVILGMSGHTVLLVALYHQTKMEQAYAYQIFLVVNETLEIVAFTLFSFAFLWGGVEGEGASWYLSSYGLMWFTAHMAIPLSEWMSVNSMLLSVSMAADRAFALGKPFVYKNISHKKHQLVALVSCTLASLLSNAYNIPLFNVGEAEIADSYAIVPNDPYLETALSNGLAYFCNAVRICGVVTLVVCNALVIRMFQARQSQVSKMTGAGSQDAKKAKEDKMKKLNEKTLVQLIVCQSTFVALSTFSEVVFYTATYVVPYFGDCEAKLLAPVLNAVLQLSALGNTFAPFLISKQCRAMVWRAMPCSAKVSDSSASGPSKGTSGTVVRVVPAPTAS